jgi:hypothetical protein
LVSTRAFLRARHLSHPELRSRVTPCDIELEEGVVGRAIGLFLFVVGIGLAAYGLPASDADQPKGIAGQTSSYTGASSIERTATADDRARAVEERSRANGSMTKLRALVAAPQAAPQPLQQVASQAQTAQAAPAIAPMDKLRAAASERTQAAADETVGTASQPLSQAAGTPPVPVPVEVSKTMRSVLQVPAVVAAARKETASAAARGANQGAAGVNAGSVGWTTTSVAGAPTQTQTTTVAIPSALRPSPNSVNNVVVADATKAHDEASEKAARLAAARDRNDNDEAKSAKPAPRTQVAQRYSPPVYLGRPAPPSYTFTYVPTSSSGSSSGGGSTPPKRKFKASEMWENNQRNGM